MSSPAQTNEPSLVDKVKQHIVLGDYVGRFVELKQSGSGQLIGKCPFHDDQNPSFGLSNAKGVYNCHGCKEHGDVINFHMKYFDVPFAEALNTLAKEYGLWKPRELTRPEKFIRAAMHKYQEGLAANPKASAYAASRKLNADTIKTFAIGFCDGNEFNRLGADGLNIAVEAGVLVPSKTAGRRPYNLMRDRLTFTIRNSSGMVVGFGGRILPDDTAPKAGDDAKKVPKYINTQETDAFKKSDLLFGLYEAKAGIYKNKYAVVVEGYMDVTILHQEGADNAVAVMGSSATEKAFESLWAVTKRVVFCLDPDAAGRAGTMRSVMKAAGSMQDHSRIDLVHLPDGLDPDEYVLKFGVESFKALCDNAMPLSLFLVGQELEAEQSRKGPFSLHLPEDRSRYLARMQDVADQFANAPVLKGEIMREAHAALSAFVIEAALKQRNVKATPEEIQMALQLMTGLLPPAPMESAPQTPAIDAEAPSQGPAPASIPLRSVNPPAGAPSSVKTSVPSNQNTPQPRRGSLFK